VTLLSAFADEISPKLATQIRVLLEQDIGYLDLRSVRKINVLDLTDRQVANVKRALHAAGIGVSAIASPIGKVPLDEPFQEHLRRFDRALELADRFETTFVRLFSFYPPASCPRPVDWGPCRSEVIRRMRQLARRAGDAGVVLLLENEKGVYGETLARCIDLLGSVDDVCFRAAFDPANFIQAGEVPYPDAYEALRPWLTYIHVKDARWDGTVTAAGEGFARWPELLSRLRQDGYDGFFSLEPHLASAGRMGGYSGAELFRYAARRFRELADGNGL
jgi:sugar phosphate isomerase/epimerase